MQVNLLLHNEAEGLPQSLRQGERDTYKVVVLAMLAVKYL